MWIYCSVQNSSLHKYRAFIIRVTDTTRWDQNLLKAKEPKQRVDLKLIPEEAFLSWSFLLGTSEISYNTHPYKKTGGGMRFRRVRVAVLCVSKVYHSIID